MLPRLNKRLLKKNNKNTYGQAFETIVVLLTEGVDIRVPGTHGVVWGGKEGGRAKHCQQ